MPLGSAVDPKRQHGVTQQRAREHVTDTGNCQPKRKLCDPIFPRPIRGVNIAKRFGRDLGLHKQILVTCAVLLIDEVKRPVNAMCPGAAASDVAIASASHGCLSKGTRLP